MPTTVSANVLPTYNQDKEHFIHIYEHLFVPAINEGGWLPISPLASGAELIHAEIIKSLFEAEIVLCDMSIHNPNVFFEMGIRCALNLPMCFVMDDKSGPPPFDTGIINYHTYKSDIRPWNIHNEIELLTRHIESSLSKSNGMNAMWQYFGLKIAAGDPISELQNKDKNDISLIRMEIEALNRRLDKDALAIPVTQKFEEYTNMDHQLILGEISSSALEKYSKEELASILAQLKGREERSKTRHEEEQIKNRILAVKRIIKQRDL